MLAGICPLPTPGVVGCRCQALTFLLPDGGVLAVCQRAGGAVAQSRQVVLITAKVLGFCPGRKRSGIKGEGPTLCLAAMTVTCGTRTRGTCRGLKSTQIGPSCSSPFPLKLGELSPPRPPKNSRYLVGAELPVPQRVPHNLRGQTAGETHRHPSPSAPGNAAAALTGRGGHTIPPPPPSSIAVASLHPTGRRVRCHKRRTDSPSPFTAPPARVPPSPPGWGRGPPRHVVGGVCRGGGRYTPAGRDRRGG